MAIPLALCATLFFAFSSTLFGDFSREVSAKWINCFKLCVAVISFGIAALVVRDGVTPAAAIYYLLSGALGLFAADHFICVGFGKLGGARTLMIFSFSPLFVATWCFLLFGERLSPHKFIAILFLMACVYTLSLEKFKSEGRWEVAGLLMVLLGVILDGLGNVTTRYGLNFGPRDGVFSICALRALGAFVAFLVSFPFLNVGLVKNFRALSLRKKQLALLSSFLGTFVSLTLWVSAVKIGDLTTLIALSGVAPLLAAIFEIFLGKTQLTKYLIAALAFFLCGFYFLILY